MTIRKIESCPPRGYVDGPQTWARLRHPPRAGHSPQASLRQSGRTSARSSWRIASRVPWNASTRTSPSRPSTRPSARSHAPRRRAWSKTTAGSTGCSPMAWMSSTGAPDGSIAGDKVWLFDFAHPERNDWLVVNQFTVIENKHNRRADLVVFVNGIPLGRAGAEEPRRRERHGQGRPSTSSRPTRRTSPACSTSTR